MAEAQAPSSATWMPDALVTALALPGLWLLATGAFLAGVVRGFTGFGTAMVYLPFAGMTLGPFAALTSLIVMDLTAPLMHVPRALREGQPRDVLRLALGSLIGLPLGVFVLSLVEPDIFRWSVSIVAVVLLVLLVSGVRYAGEMNKPLVIGTGGLGGFFCGSVGLPGPPVIMLYMASKRPVAAIRANITLYLILAEILMLITLGIGGLLVSSAIMIGVLMIAPYLFGNWIGAVLFRPEAEKVYRWTAYAIIAASALAGLPLWD